MFTKCSPSLPKFVKGFYHTRAKCEIRVIILIMVFWPVCTQVIRIMNANFDCKVQTMIRRCFPVMHL